MCLSLSPYVHAPCFQKTKRGWRCMLDCVDSIGVNLFSLFLFSLLSLSLRPAPLLRSLLLTFERSAFSPLSLSISLSLSFSSFSSFFLSLSSSFSLFSFSTYASALSPLRLFLYDVFYTRKKTHNTKGKNILLSNFRVAFDGD